MGILLNVVFRGKTAGTILSRRDEEGNFLSRETDSAGTVYYQIVEAPPIPVDFYRESGICGAPSGFTESGEYVQMSDDVFIDLSCFHPLMYISHLLVYSYGVKNGIEQVELMLSFPRGYGNKIESQLDLYSSNRGAVAQKWIAEDVLFQSGTDLAVYDIADIQIISQDDSTELKLLLNSRSFAKKRRQQKIMQSPDLCCTLILNKGKRDFFMGIPKQVNKKGH